MSAYDGGADDKPVQAHHNVARKLDQADAGGRGGYAAYIQGKAHETWKAKQSQRRRWLHLDPALPQSLC